MEKKFIQMKKKNIALLIMFFGLFNISFAQGPVVINFSDETVSSGSSVTVDVTSENFADITGLQLYIGYDGSMLEFTGITNINSELDGFNMSSFATPNSVPTPLPEGHINISWFTTNIFGDSETLPDGTILFSIVLNAVGDDCDETSFELVNYNGQPNEAYDGNFNVLALTFDPGLVNIPGTDCGGGSGGGGNGLGLIGEQLVAEAGTNVCVAISVDSFVNINSAQFAIQYDESVLEYTGFMDGPLTDELVNPTGANYIRFLWLVPANEGPTSIPDGETLIEFCFNVIGNLNDCSPIDIISISTPPALDIELIDGDGSVVDYYTESGEVCVGTPVENPVTFIASNETGDLNQNICMDITTENFTDIGGFQWAFTWNSNVMTYSGLGTVNNIGINPTDIVSQSADLLRVSWFPTSGLTLPDGTVLFQLCYDVEGDCDTQTDASFVNDGNDFQIEVGNADGDPLPHEVVNGSFTIECACNLTYTLNNVSCYGEKDGNIYITLNGCTAASFLWSTGQITQNLEGIGAGTYQVTVTDDNGGQTISDVINIGEPTVISTTENINQVTCAGKGSIVLSVSGGSPGYSYQWNPNVSTGPSAINLDPGMYSVTITDSKDCAINKNFSITSSIIPLVVNGTMNDISCFGTNDGSINISPDGACQPYNIIWSDGQATGVFSRTGLAAGLYTATVTDQSGASKSISFTITNPASALNIDGGVTHADMGGTGSIDITVTGGAPAYTYSWTNGAITQDIVAVAGTYTVLITDTRGCTIQASYTIKEFLTEVILSAEQNDLLYNGYGVSCFGECDGKINLDVTANEPWILFLDGVETDEADFNNIDFCAGEYTIKVVDDRDLESTVVVTVSEPDQLIVTLDEIICSNGDDGSIQVDVSGGIESYAYNWGVSGQTDALIEGLGQGTYGVVVTDENKCQALLADLKVTACDIGDCFIGMPVITPNSDGLNDYFTISCLKDYDDNNLSVYDRWGQKVFVMDNYDGTWNGTGTDGELQEGSYMWVLIANLANGDEKLFKGTVTILR